MKTKVIILVLSTEFNPYDLLEKSVRETWLNLNSNSVPVFFYYGSNESENKIIDDKVYINVPETFGNITIKTLKMFEFIYKNFEFDYLFRTNLSSYIDIDLLYSFLDDKPKLDFYSGLMGCHDGVDFCSGAGFFLSRNLVEIIVNNKNLYESSHMDDVIIAKILKEYGISPIKGDRFDFPSDNPPMNYFHYRVKENHSNYWELDRSVDVKNMNFLYELKKLNKKFNQ
jgi:hypothetical protein